MTRIAIGSLLVVLAAGLVGLPPAWDRLAPGAASAAEDPAALLQKFEAFASTWMEKLRERERFNAGKIKWQKVGDGVEGVYVGYDTASYRILPLSNVETMPIGKLVYLELKLRLRGDTEDAARAGQPEIVERVEVTELFRYDHGKWIY